MPEIKNCCQFWSEYEGFCGNVADDTKFTTVFGNRVFFCREHADEIARHEKLLPYQYSVPGGETYTGFVVDK